MVLSWMFRVRSVLLFALLLGTCGCANPMAGPPPTDLDELAPIIADLQLVEALNGEMPVVLRDSLREAYYDKVLADHGTDRATVDSLMWLVRQEPEWMDSLYTQVGEILGRKNSRGVEL